MLYMLGRNKIEDFDKWHTVFPSHEAAHRKAGLILESLWQDVDDPNSATFLFRVEDREKAEAFIENSDAADSAHASGVVEGEYRFVLRAASYGG